MTLGRGGLGRGEEEGQDQDKDGHRSVSPLLFIPKTRRKKGNRQIRIRKEKTKFSLTAYRK